MVNFCEHGNLSLAFLDQLNNYNFQEILCTMELKNQTVSWLIRQLINQYRMESFTFLGWDVVETHSIERSPLNSGILQTLWLQSCLLD